MEICLLLLLLRRRKINYYWSTECQAESGKPKIALSTALDLRYANLKLAHDVTADDTEIKIGGFFTQSDEIGTKPVASTTRKLIMLKKLSYS